jgi:hypothetical protein
MIYPGWVLGQRHVIVKVCFTADTMVIIQTDTRPFKDLGLGFPFRAFRSKAIPVSFLKISQPLSDEINSEKKKIVLLQDPSHLPISLASWSQDGDVDSPRLRKGV